MTIYPFIDVAKHSIITNATDNVPAIMGNVQLLAPDKYARFVTGDECYVQTGTINTVTTNYYNEKYSIDRKVGDIITVADDAYLQTSANYNIFDSGTETWYSVYPHKIDEFIRLKDGWSIGAFGQTLTRVGDKIRDEGGSTYYFADGDKTILDFLWGANKKVVDEDVASIFVYKDFKVYRIHIGNAPEPSQTGTHIFARDIELKHTAYLRETSRLLPFDDKGYTSASSSVVTVDGESMLYFRNIKPTTGESFNKITLSNIVADRYRIIPNGAVPNGDEIMRDITLTHNGTTETVHFSTPIHMVSIELWRADKGKVSIGTIGLSSGGIDVGVTKFNASATMNDNSPHEVKKGGYVDYIPGITTFKDTVTTIIPIENDKTLQNFRGAIKVVKRRRMAFDIGDRWHGKDDINAAMIVVARVDSVSYSLQSGKIDGLPAKYIEARWTIGEAS